MVEPGEYAVFVTPAAFEGAPCGSGINDYQLTISCDVLCPADVDNDGVVAVGDLIDVIVNWGDCPAPCAADVTGDGDVGVQDLVEVVLAWGTCTSCPADVDEDGVVGVNDLVEVMTSMS